MCFVKGLANSNLTYVPNIKSRMSSHAALRMIAYGVIGDFINEYVQIGEPTAVESLKKFVTVVIDIFSEEYLRKPNNKDIGRLLAYSKRRGFLGMLGSIDDMHWKWKNCPTA